MPGETVEVTLQDASWIVVGMMLYAEAQVALPTRRGIFRFVGKRGNTIMLLNPPGFERAGRAPKSKTSLESDRSEVTCYLLA
jgi:hypothetical protein